MKAIFFVLFVAVVLAQGSIMCNLCLDFVNTLEKLITEKGQTAAREYIDTLCSETSGVLYTLCETFLNFGVDEILKLIENHAQPLEVCQHMDMC